MTLSDILFYLLALLAIAGGAGVAFSKNVVYSAFSLLAALFAVAGIYIFVSADLLAVVQVLVYIGGILVLILFAIMLTNKIGDARGTNLGINFGAASVVFALMICITILVAVATPWGQFVGDGLPTLRDAGLTAKSSDIGNALLRKYLLPFEIASIVLLATIIGAVIIARKEMRLLVPNRDKDQTP